MPTYGGYTRSELRTLRHLRTPELTARFLDEQLGYNKEAGGETCYSVRSVLRHGVAHCMEGAMLAAAALELQGRPALIWDLEAVRDDDHVLALYREEDGAWGAIAKSNYAGIRHRSPVYRSLRELAMSYFEHYFNPVGEKTLRGYGARPVNMARFDGRVDWRTGEQDVWEIPDYLCKISHRPLLLTPAAARRRYRMDRRLYEAGFHGAAK